VRVSMHSRSERRRSLGVAVVTVALALLGAALAAIVLVTDLAADGPDVDWPVVIAAGVLLVLAERTPATWIRFDPLGSVTPLWMCSYAILLLGSPAAAVLAAITGSVVHRIVRREPLDVAVRSVSIAAISVAAGGLAMRSVGADGAITQFDRLPWGWAAAIALAGAVLLVVNAVGSAVSVSCRGRLSFVSLLRRGFYVRLTAEGALLSLAPIWVIGTHSSLVLVPLLFTTTVLVFRSARQALERYHEAHHDPLTGLLNRRGFLDELAAALDDPRTASHLNLMIMDLNGFKEINDRLGHQIGDSLLVQYGTRLDESRPDGSVAARLGGDEFALLVLGEIDTGKIDQMVSELHELLSRPLVVEGFPISVGVSIGVATAPTDGRTTRDLLRAADVAMYRAKRTNTPTQHYGDCVQGPQRGRLNLLSDLGDALANHQLHIQFQPQLRIATGEVDTVEALIRWQHPEHGSIPPSEFIGLAEQTDLIGPITEMVLRASTSGLLAAGHDVRLAVNVSARSIQDRYFASQVLALLAQTGFPPERLELEVTERAIVSHAERSTYTIDQLRHAGVRIAIDDFGVGYASFQTLRLIDVDRVKLDRDFVRGVLTERRDRLIVSSLIRLAHELDLDVVAEGVESTAVWDELALLGCDIAQGYGIAVPMRFSELRTWLTRWNELVVEQHDDARSPIVQESFRDDVVNR
jgi:diguanylate cyclase (GGDEF)-like protein